MGEALISLLRNAHPDIAFATHDEVKPERYYATYSIGLFFDDSEFVFQPCDFRHVGLIHLILPRARIIDARREPMACCFSNFKQLFAEGQEFTYSLEDIGRYYQMYVGLMQHWDEVLPGRVLRVQHEELVADLDGQLRRMLGFLELDYDARCLEFHRVERSVRTASQNASEPTVTPAMSAHQSRNSQSRWTSICVTSSRMP